MLLLADDTRSDAAQMLVHSASQQSRAGTSRYVLFTTFFDMSASYALLPVRGASLHPRKFTPDFRQALGPELAYLLCLLLSLLAVKLCVVNTYRWMLDALCAFECLCVNVVVLICLWGKQVFIGLGPPRGPRREQLRQLGNGRESILAKHRN